MTEEKDILQLGISKEKNPFKVPEGYFENVTLDVMSKIAAEERKPKKSVFRILRPILAVAACVAIAIFSINIFFESNNKEVESSSYAQSAYSDSYIDAAADYAMLDNGDLYALMADEGM